MPPLRQFGLTLIGLNSYKNSVERAKSQYTWQNGVLEQIRHPFLVFNQESIVYLNASARQLGTNQDWAQLLEPLNGHNSTSGMALALPWLPTQRYLAETGTIAESDLNYCMLTPTDENKMHSILARIVEESSVSIILFDANMRILYINRFGRKLYKYDEQELIGQPIQTICGKENYASEFKKKLAYVKKHGIWRGEDMRRKKNGEVFYSSSSITRVTNPDGSFLCYYDASHDDKIRHHRTTQLEEKANTDPLTGLANRRALSSLLKHQWNLAKAKNIPFAIIFVDIDDFKKYNDTYGHLNGDKVLIRVANKMKNLIRTSDSICRYGGEEFVIVLVGAGVEDIQKISHKLLKGVDNLHIPHKSSTVSDHVTISVGVCIITPERMERQKPTNCLRNADKALYRAKGTGKNKFVLVNAGEEFISPSHPNQQKLPD